MTLIKDETCLTKAALVSQDDDSLHGIWQGTGFEKIVDLDDEIKMIRKQLSDLILEKTF